MEKKKILIVDDDENITTLFKEILESTNKYEVMTETGGTRAFSVVKQFNPDLVLLDIMMPHVDGGEVASQLKADDDTKDIPIIFISAALTKEEAMRVKTIQGGTPIIAKPIRVRELMDAVESKVGEKTAPEDRRDGLSTDEKKALKGLEKRKHNRISIEGQFSYLGMDDSETPYEGGAANVINVSQGGVCLETKTAITSSRIQLSAAGMDDERISIKGRVVYSRMEDSGGYRTGVEFMDSDEKKRKFVAEFVRIINSRKSR